MPGRPAHPSNLRDPFMRRTGRTCSHVPVRLTGAALPAASDPSPSARLKRDGAFRPLTPEMGLFT